MQANLYLKYKKYLQNGLFKLNLFTYPALFDMTIRNGGHSLMGLFIRMIPSMGGRVTLGLLRDLRILISRIARIGRTQGVKGLVIYLKKVSVITQQVTGKYIVPSNNPRVKVNRSGKPLLIPKNLRKFLGHDGSFFIMRLVLTVLSLYRDFIYTSKVKTETITNPKNSDLKLEKEIINFIPLFVKFFVKRKLSGSGVLKGKFRFFPILTSSPQTSIFAWNGDPGKPEFNICSSSMINLIRSAAVMPQHYLQYFSNLMALYIDPTGESYQGMFKRFSENFGETGIFAQRCNIAGTPPLTGILEYLMESGLDMLGDFKGYNPLRPTHSFIGKLGLKQEAAGKMRVFAMLDPWTQWIMYPLHKGLFDILSSRSNVDGTFDQHQNIKRRFKLLSNLKLPLFSMDLSAATDRLPMSLQTPLISKIFNFSEIQGESWQQLLIERPYLVPHTKGQSVLYACGQPMGALSSWAMLAMTHHLLVQFAAFKAIGSYNSLFVQYVVLGDDIVIFDKPVAKQYHRILTSLGVECNLSKSIVCPSGHTLEFAKHTYWKGIDISPRPLKEFFMSQVSIVAMVEYVRKYNLTIPQALKLCGFGWRVISGYQRSFFKQNLKVRYLILLLSLSEFRFIDTLSRLLSKGYINFLINFSDYILSYMSNLISKVESLLKKVENAPLDQVKIQPLLYEKEWVDTSTDKIIRKKVKYSWPRNPLRGVIEWMTILHKMDAFEINPLQIYLYLNSHQLAEITNLCNQALSDIMIAGTAVDIVLDRAQKRDFLDPQKLGLKTLVMALMQTIEAESVISKKSITDLDIRPSENLYKKPNDPKLFRIHQALTKFLANAAKGAFLRDPKSLP